MATTNTNNWDTVSAIKFKTVNAAIVSQGATPPSFSGAAQNPLAQAVTLTGNFNPWQLSGGSGNLVQMNLPFRSATATPTGGGAATELGAGYATIEVNLSYLPQPGATNAQNLQVSPQQVVTSISVTMANTSVQNWSGYVSMAIQSWLGTNLQQFNHVFAVANLGSQETSPSFVWVVPTKVSYAVEVTGGSVDDYVFGVLAMTENRIGENLSSQISPYAIPTGADAAFLISTERFLEKMFLPGMALLFQGASAADFDITADGSQITNINELGFKAFLVPTNESGTETKTISDAKIAAGKFALTAFANHLRIDFTDLTYTWQEGYIVNVNYSGMTGLTMDSTNHLQMPESSDPTVSFVVTKTTAQEWKEFGETIGIDIGIALVGALIGGAAEAASAARAAESAVTQVVRDAVAEAGDAAAIDGAVNIPLLTPQQQVALRAAMAQDALAGAAEQLANPSALSKFTGFFLRNWKIILGVIVAEAVGTTLSQIPEILNHYAEKDLEHMPTLDTFATAAVSPIQWTNVPQLRLSSITLNGPVQMGLTITAS